MKYNHDHELILLPFTINIDHDHGLQRLILHDISKWSWCQFMIMIKFMVCAEDKFPWSSQGVNVNFTINGHGPCSLSWQIHACNFSTGSFCTIHLYTVNVSAFVCSLRVMFKLTLPLSMLELFHVHDQV